MRLLATLVCIVTVSASRASGGPYAPAAGTSGSTAIANTSASFLEWASGVQSLVRGPVDIANPGGPVASFGAPSEALGPADGNSSHVVSLGDGGQITLTFLQAITNGPGADLAVFENSFSDTFLELAFVEVSTNGTDFVRFPAVSLTQTSIQVGSFGKLDPTDLDNLAGKYRAAFGTPFDLSQVDGLSAEVNVNQVHFVRVIDVVGSINPTYGTLDSLGNLINDPYPTAFASGGFDLDGIGVIHMVAEPASGVVLLMGAALACWITRRRGRS